MSRTCFICAIAVTLAAGMPAEAAPNITTTSLPAGAIGEAYNQTLAANGGKQPYKWSVKSGSLPPGLHLAMSGNISGMPSSAGNSSFTVEVVDANNMTGTQPLSITVAAALTITTTSLPEASPGAAYSQQLAAAGGSGSNTWLVAGGPLPQGLALSAGGAISGTPTAAGNSNFTVQVKDSGGGTATKPLSINVDPPPLTITTASLPGGTVGMPYAQNLAANGGSGGYIWSITAGSLPGGLNLSGGGMVSGMPSAAGSFPFTVQVKDSSGATATKPLSITVNAALSITTASLPTGSVGVAYSQTLTATGGTGGYTWTVGPGSLPAGLNLSGGGMISGTPSAAGSSMFTVQVKDSSGATATKPLSITVNAALSITTASLPAGSVGVAYSQTLAATGGTGGYTWTVTAGSLPAGLNLSGGGMISGTPSAAGSSMFTVQVKDNSGATATKQLSITINAALSITTASLPPGAVGAPYSQTLAATGGTGGYTWTVTEIGRAHV